MSEGLSAKPTLRTVKYSILFRWIATAYGWCFKTIWITEIPQLTWQRIFGRALGRVLTHQMSHVLARTRTHGRTGVTKGTLSALDLMAPELQMDAASLRLIEAASVNKVTYQAGLPGF